LPTDLTNLSGSFFLTLFQNKANFQNGNTQTGRASRVWVLLLLGIIIRKSAVTSANFEGKKTRGNCKDL
jgi:hypothetical protein